jgi:hypothetical protein
MGRQSVAPHDLGKYEGRLHRACVDEYRSALVAPNEVATAAYDVHMSSEMCGAEQCPLRISRSPGRARARSRTRRGDVRGPHSDRRDPSQLLLGSVRRCAAKDSACSHRSEDPVFDARPSFSGSKY